MKRILGLIMAMVMCGVLIASAFVNDSQSASLIKQDASNDIYNQLLQSFTENGKYHLEEHYPDYYAGAYIGDDSSLIILTKNASDNDIAQIKKICGNIDYSIKSAQYSYNELIAAKNIISDNGQKIRENKLYDCPVLSIGIRDNHNKIYIGISNLESKELTAYLTKEIDSSLYELYEATAPQEFNAYYPGDYIYGYVPGSAAYQARILIDGQVKNGFITAGHVTNGSDVYTNWTHWTKIGNTIVEQNSGSVDAAFVELTGGNTFTNIVDGYNMAIGTSVIPAVNSTVYKVGSQSGTTSGYVISNINESWWEVNGVDTKFTNLCDTTVPCVYGDSGGLMYTKSGTTYKVVGTMKGGTAYISSATKHVYLPWTLTITP